MIIVFEGLDKSGKTTLKNAFNKATNYEYVTIDRGPWSNMFYDTVIHSSEYDATESHRRFGQHLLDSLKMSKSVSLIVYCQSNYLECEKRHLEANESLPEHINKLDYPMYDEYFWNIVNVHIYNHVTRTIVIRTDNGDSVEQSVNRIMEVVKEIKGEK